jgi:hypothetical protein
LGKLFSFNSLDKNDESDEWSNKGDEDDWELFLDFLLLFASNGLFALSGDDDDDESNSDLSLFVEKSSSIRSGFDEWSNVISNNDGWGVADGLIA